MSHTGLAFATITMSLPLIFIGVRAVGREEKTFRFFRSFHTESGALGTSGSLLLAIAAYLLKTVHWDWAASMLWVVAAISFMFCGLAWLAGTKLGYWIDNQRWPKSEAPSSRDWTPLVVVVVVLLFALSGMHRGMYDPLDFNPWPLVYLTVPLGIAAGVRTKSKKDAAMYLALLCFMIGTIVICRGTYDFVNHTCLESDWTKWKNWPVHFSWSLLRAAAKYSAEYLAAGLALGLLSRFLIDRLTAWANRQKSQVRT